MHTVIMLSLNTKLVFNYTSLTVTEVQLLTYTRTRASQDNTHLKQNRKKKITKDIPLSLHNAGNGTKTA
jgi:hypothetical protein